MSAPLFCFWGSFWAIVWVGCGLKSLFRIHSCKLINFNMKIFWFLTIRSFYFGGSIRAFFALSGYGWGWYGVWKNFGPYLPNLATGMGLDKIFGIYSFRQRNFVFVRLLFSDILIFCFLGSFWGFMGPNDPFWGLGLGPEKIFEVDSMLMNQ